MFYGCSLLCPACDQCYFHRKGRRKNSQSLSVDLTPELKINNIYFQFSDGYLLNDKKKKTVKGAFHPLILLP
jgi:hypothetical protein